MTDSFLAFLPFLAVPIVLLFRFVGCCEPFDSAPSIALTLVPAVLVVNQGESAVVTVRVESLAGYDGTVEFSASVLPPGVTAVFVPAIVKPPPGGQITSALTLTATPTATSGPTKVTITGRWQPSAGMSPLQNAELALTVNAVKPDFSLTLQPPVVNVVPGGVMNLVVNIARIGGFSGAVDLTATDAGGAPLPTVVFNPDPAPGAASSMAAAVPPGTPAGTHGFVVRGTSGGLTRATNGTVVVT